MTTQRVKPLNRDVNAGVRASLAIELRAQKVPYDEIATKCGYASRGAAHNAVMRELERRVADNVDELRQEELASLDNLEQKIWQEALYSVSAKTGEKYLNLFAVDRIIAIKERRARMMGIDVPTNNNIAAAQVIIREYGADTNAV